jgi:hypothetical protein
VHQRENKHNLNSKLQILLILNSISPKSLSSTPLSSKSRGFSIQPKREALFLQQAAFAKRDPQSLQTYS